MVAEAASPGRTTRSSLAAGSIHQHHRSSSQGPVQPQLGGGLQAVPAIEEGPIGHSVSMQYRLPPPPGKLRCTQSSSQSSLSGCGRAAAAG